jgi:uncharacterized membrane protein YeaQ/YmgE (transglycosylase-associated protein family)
MWKCTGPDSLGHGGGRVDHRLRARTWVADNTGGGPDLHGEADVGAGGDHFERDRDSVARHRHLRRQWAAANRFAIERQVRSMFEHIIQIGPMLVLAGLLAGWVAEAVSRAGGYGFILDMFVGLVGSVVAGAIVWALTSSNIGMLAMLLIGCGGASLAIAAQRGLWRSALLGT